jgi:CP family cyanate transporter-like MFS transporter
MKNKMNFPLMLGIIFIAFNLRAAITSVGPLVSLIRQDLVISNLVAGFITTIPLLFFAIGSVVSSRVGRILGMERALLYALFLIFFGILLRSFTATRGFFIGTALIGLGIALGNVLVPALIKQRFPMHMGLIIGIYSVSLTLMASVSVGISYPLAVLNNTGWKKSLAIWAVMAALAILVWLPQVRKSKMDQGPFTNWQPKGRPEKSVYTSKLAWQITFFNGLQSLLFYCFIAWLPTIVQSGGLYQGSPGTLSLIYLLVSMPANFVIPVLCHRLRNQRLVVLMLCGIYLAGMTLFYFANSLSLLVISIILCGLGMGSCFSYSLALIGLRTSNPQEASALSGMTQAVGYLMAAVGPTLIGGIYDKTEAWTIPMMFLILAILCLLMFGWKAGDNKKIFQENQSKAGKLPDHAVKPAKA